ncbi:hypothetical protein SRHO_G00248230 [Serrasalmus rhombeus]
MLIHANLNTIVLPMMDDEKKKQLRISGTEVEMRVRPGDNVVLYSDCVWKIGITVWLTNSSNEKQPPLIITPDDLKQGAFSHHAFVWNHYNGTHDLLVKNVTESDLGLYYCARRERKLTAAGDLQHVYHYGNRTTRLALLGEKNDHERENRNKEDQKRTTYDEVGGDIIYAPLDVMSRGQKRVKTNGVQRSDICTYSETSAQTSASKTLTIVTHPAPVSEMERSRAVLLTLACVLFSRISGAEVEMRFRPGDNVILYSDCVSETGSVVWFRNSSNETKPPLIISGDTLIQAAFSRYSFVWNPSNKTRDLLVKNVTESDLGLYYCALQKIKFMKNGTGADVRADVYQHGNRTTRLSLLDSTAPCADLQTPSTPPVSDCSICWKLLVSVCPVCVLLSSTCLCCICRYTTKVEKEDKKKSERAQQHQKRRSDEVGEDGVCYASLDHQNRGQKRLKKKRVESSDFSTYSETSAQTSASKTLTIVTHPAPVSEMERSRAVLITLVCALFSRISGAEVEMRVRPGDNVILYSDCIWQIRTNIVWFRNSSNENQPRLIISPDDLIQGAFSHHALVWNHHNQTQDLLVKNVTESELGLYYCARRGFQLKTNTGAGDSMHVYHYGNRTIRLSLLDTTPPSTPPVSDCHVCWKLMVGGDDVIYAPLDVTTRGQNRLKKNRVQRSDICTYSEVKLDQM